LKIIGLETFPVRNRFKTPARWPVGVRKSAYSLIIKLKTDEGLTGLGEAPGPYVSVNRTVIEQELKPLLLGQDPFEIEKIISRLEILALWDKYFVYPISGVEMALYDIVGKSLKTPLYNMFGGLVNERVEFNGLIFINEPAEDAALAIDYVKLGCREIKMKVGLNPERDVERLKTVRQAVGPNIKIRVDANQAWSVATSIKYVKKMERYDLQAVEQPVPIWDLEGMAEIRRAVDTPLIADESVWTLKDAYDIISKRAADIFYVRIEEAGGMLRCKELVDFAKALGIPCIMGSWAEMGVSIAAKLHLVASSTNFPFGNDTHYLLQSDDVIKGGMFHFADGAIKVPTGPGLGVELNEEKLTSLAIQKNIDSEELFYSNKPGAVPRVGAHL
jgi:L-alanine-DL-glutamate epimerase-like enolase superfamily enzyme